MSTPMPQARPANKWQRAVIIVKSIWFTLCPSVAVLWKSLWGRCDRASVDRLTHDWATNILNTAGISYQLHNPHQVVLEPNHAYVVMSNHRSHYDIPIIVATFPGSIRMIAKKELFKIPIWGPALLKAEFLSIDRDNRRQAWRDLAYAKEKMDSGIVVWIAPEGTRSQTGELSPFKKGGFMLAMQTGATIIPVAITGTEKVLPARSLQFSKGVHVDVSIGEPITQDASAKKDYPALMQRVESAIAGLLVPRA